MKQKLKNYSFWVGLSASIMLVVKFVAENFGFKIDENLINNIINSILGILTILGVINSPTKSNSTNGVSNEKLDEEDLVEVVEDEEKFNK